MVAFIGRVPRVRRPEVRIAGLVRNRIAPVLNGQEIGAGPLHGEAGRRSQHSGRRRPESVSAQLGRSVAGTCRSGRQKTSHDTS